MPDEISFTKVALPYGWLGNMAPYKTWHLGFMYPTSEALFQALRFEDLGIREAIRTARSPMTAKMLAKSYKDKMTIKPQGEADLENMRLVLGLKFEQHTEIREMLLATGLAILIEDCTARPRGSGLFWGAAKNSDGTWCGENHLGKLWMELRAKHAPKGERRS